MKALIWNIRSVNTQKPFTRLMNLNKRHQFYWVGITEPFEEEHKIETFRRKLGMKHAVSNVNSKIWAFLDEVVDYNIVRDEEQMLILNVHNREIGLEKMISLVYAKCNQRERLQLWESLKDLSNSTTIPWLIGRGF